MTDKNELNASIPDLPDETYIPLAELEEMAKTMDEVLKITRDLDLPLKE